MKAKISGIPFETEKKPGMKKINEPARVLPSLKALVYNASGKIELRDIPIPTIRKPSDAGQLANAIFQLARR